MSQDFPTEDMQQQYEALRERGEDALNLGQYELALALFQQSQTLAPNHPEPYNNIGRAYFRMDQLENAEEFYKKAIELDASFGRAFSNLCVLYTQCNNFVLALQYGEQALKINPEHPLTQNALGNLYVDLAQPAQAEIHYKKALSLEQTPHATFMGIQYNYARLLYDTQRYKEARLLFEELLPCPPKDAELDILLRLGYIFSLEREEDGYADAEAAKRVIDTYEQLLTQYETDSRLNNEARFSVHYKLGMAYYDCGEFHKAIFHLNRCREIDQDLVEESVVGFLASAYIQLKEYVLAEKFYKRYLNILTPINHEYTYYLGFCLYHQQKYFDLIALLHPIYSELPSARKGYAAYYLGVAFQEAQQWDKSLFYYQHYIDVEPKKSDGYFRLSEVYEALGDTEAAQEYRQKAQES